MKFWERPEFIAMQRDWYARLKDLGFEDVEEAGYDERIRHDMPLLAQGPIAADRRRYCELLAERLETATFANPTDELIMQMRAEGARIKEIVEKIVEAGSGPVYVRRAEHFGETYVRRAVRYRIRVYEMKWGLRSYTAKQLGRKAG